MNPFVMAGFAAELERLEKTAGPLSMVEGLGARVVSGARNMFGKGMKTLGEGPENWSALGQRLQHPIKRGLPEGWAALSPRAEMLKKAPQELADFKAFHAKPTTGRLAALKHRLGSEQHLTEHLPGRSFFGEGGTFTGKTIGESYKNTAEELSRRGWTGRGAVTKYLPVGGKGMTVGFTATGIPAIVNAPRPTETGEGGALERGVGDVLGTGGFIVGTGLGGVTGLGTGMLAQKGGAKVGRILDRLRAGASLRTAVSAPSPTEASNQLAKIQQYYGG